MSALKKKDVCSSDKWTECIKLIKFMSLKLYLWICFRYTIFNLQHENQFVVSLSMKNCLLSSTCEETSLLTSARMPKLACNGAENTNGIFFCLSYYIVNSFIFMDNLFRKLVFRLLCEFLFFARSILRHLNSSFNYIFVTFWIHDVFILRINAEIKSMQKMDFTVFISKTVITEHWEM